MHILDNITITDSSKFLLQTYCGPNMYVDS